jgi:predicted nucleic acid-binding protein
MSAALLDTNAVSDLMRDHANVKARVGNHPDPVLTNVIVLGEVRYGLSRLPPGKKRNDLESRAQSILTAFLIEPVTVPIADAYGHLRASLESQGINLDDNDLWIATTALNLSYLLVSRDQIFSRVPGLHVEDWSV